MLAGADIDKFVIRATLMNMLIVDATVATGGEGRKRKTLLKFEHSVVSKKLIEVLCYHVTKTKRKI